MILRFFQFEVESLQINIINKQCNISFMFKVAKNVYSKHCKKNQLTIIIIIFPDINTNNICFIQIVRSVYIALCGAWVQCSLVKFHFLSLLYLCSRRLFRSSINSLKRVTAAF